MGCDLIQGYLISHPIPLGEFEVFLVEHRNAHPDGALPTPALEWNLDAAAATMRP
jgi:hypothetical protein